MDVAADLSGSGQAIKVEPEAGQSMDVAVEVEAGKEIYTTYILALDLSSKCSGYALTDVSGGTLVDLGVIVRKKGDKTAESYAIETTQRRQGDSGKRSMQFCGSRKKYHEGIFRRWPTVDGQRWRR